jgi:hypothetical protein
MSFNNLNRMSRRGIRTLALVAASLLAPALSSATHAAPATKNQAHIVQAIGGHSQTVRCQHLKLARN